MVKPNHGAQNLGFGWTWMDLDGLGWTWSTVIDGNCNQLDWRGCAFSLRFICLLSSVAPCLHQVWLRKNSHCTCWVCNPLFCHHVSSLLWRGSASESAAISEIVTTSSTSSISSNIENVLRLQFTFTLSFHSPLWVSSWLKSACYESNHY